MKVNKSKYLDLLEKYITEDNVFKAEDVMGKIMQVGDKQEIMSMLLFIPDKPEAIEIAYSIIHSVETLERDYYVSSFINHFQQFYSNSSYWAEEVLDRIIQTPEYYEQLKSKLDAQNNECLRTVLSKM
jgi:hypothetical protein